MRTYKIPNGDLFLEPKTAKDFELIDHMAKNDLLSAPKLSRLLGQNYAVKGKNIPIVEKLLKGANK